ncbi:MAG: Arm DNA-binding domain-containing protein [Anaerorhabdus sp.]
MAVRKEENGKWTVDVYIENHDGTKKRYKKRGFLSKREAADFEYKIKNSNISSQLEKFSYYLEQYLANSNSSADTKKRKRRTLEIYAPTLIDKPINRITKPNLLTWRNELSELAISTTQKNKVLEYFKAVFKFAYEFYDVKNISIVLQTFRKTDKERMREFETWTVDEFNRFISHSDNLIITAYYTLLFYTGARVGEILALYKSDVDTKAATINISKSIRSSKEGIKAPKTRNSIRKIKIDTQTLNTLLPLLKRKGK